MLFHKQQSLRNCGQIAVACIADRSLEDVVRIIGHNHGTKTRELAKALRRFGFKCARKCTRLRPGQPWPELALAQMHQEGRKSGWHWVAIGDGKVWDGTLEGPVDVWDYERIVSDYPFKGAGRLTSALVVERANGSTHKTTKGYPRITAGPLRNQYIHRIVAAALLGRELERDEEVHHRDGNRLNCAWNNLVVLGHKDHGWVSAKQAWFMRNLDDKLKAEWDTFMAKEEERFQSEIKAAKAAGEPWQVQDGQLAERWENRQPLEG